MLAGSDSSHHIDPPILAMVIGINNYQSDKFKNLSCAISDAVEFERYLQSLKKKGRHVEILPPLHDATRNEILDGFFALGTKYPELKDNAAIVIFYAGHGARTTKPPEWKDWNTPSGEVEMICPSDIGKVDNGSVEVEGIYDRTISALLCRLSGAMGNNITLILDCCCAGGASRGEDDPNGEIVREIFEPPAARVETDRDICSSGDRGAGPTNEFAGKLHASHVLLAACAPDQAARENRQLQHGYFTLALLQVLKKEDVRHLTYTSLMHKLKLNNNFQTPRCEGYGVNWRLFNNRDSGSNWSFILTHHNDNTIIMDAGSAQGITPRSRFSLHTNNLIASTSQGELEVKSVALFSSTLQVLKLNRGFKLPDLFYSKLVYAEGPKINIYCPDTQLQKSAFPPKFVASSGMHLVVDDTSCDLELRVSKGWVSFYRHHACVRPHLTGCIPDKIAATDICTIRKVVCAARSFYYHLTRSDGMTDDLTKAGIKLFELKFKEAPSGNSSASDKDMSSPIEEAILVPENDTNLVESEPATITIDDDALYGMAIVNETNLRLYPFVFYFDPTRLSIEEWYPPPFDISGCGLKAPSLGSGLFGREPNGVLAPGSSLDIGYGHSEVWPWGFTLPQEVLGNGETRVRKKDLGFFRVFLSTRPMPSFFSMKLESPFPSTNSDRGGEKKDPTIRLATRRAAEAAKDERCGTKLVTIIHVKDANDTNEDLDSDLPERPTPKKIQRLLSRLKSAIKPKPRA